jgi:hypothetical protein
MKKKKIVIWNPKWNPSIATLQKNEGQYEYERRNKALKQVYWDGKHVYATNGKLMACYPTTKKVGKKQSEKELPIKKCLKTLPPKRFKVAFNPLFLMRLLKALGHNEKKPGVIMEFNIKDNHSMIKVHPTYLHDGAVAWGVLMPMRNVGEDVKD